LLGSIADIIGIISFILTIVLLIRSESLRNQILIQKQDYKKYHSKVKIRLMSLAESIREDDQIPIQTTSLLRQELYEHLHNFNLVLSRKDKKIINSVINTFDKAINEDAKRKLLKNLDYLVARFSKKEE